MISLNRKTRNPANSGNNLEGEPIVTRLIPTISSKVIQLGSSLASLSSTDTRYIMTRTMNKKDNSKTFKLIKGGNYV